MTNLSRLHRTALAARKPKNASGGLTVRSTRRPTKRAKTDAYHHGNLREALIECGLRLLDEVGLQAMTLRQTARMAGVSQTAPRNHFRDKEGLLAAIAAHGFDVLTRTRLEMLRGKTNPEERLRIMIWGYVKFAMERPALFNLMFGPTIQERATYPELEEVANRSYNFLYSVVGEFAASRSSVQRTSEFHMLAIWCVNHGLAMLLSNGHKPPRLDPRASPRMLSDGICKFVIAALTSPSNRVEKGRLHDK